MTDLSVVLNAHREGLLLHRTLRSVRRALEEAVARGLHVELVAVLDAADHLTARVAAGFPGVSRIEAVSFADLASSRNHGAQVAAGRYVAFVDGDDLVSGTWFADAYARFRDEPDQAVKLALHPELNVYFGDEHYVYAHVDQASADFRYGNLVEFNYWTALTFARRDDLLGLPYRSSMPAAGLGYEDWDWNCRTLASGWRHHVVPRTFHFIRRQSKSMSLDLAATRAVVRPSPYFEHLSRIADAQALESWEARGVTVELPAPRRSATGRLLRRSAAWLAGSQEGANFAVDHLVVGARALARRMPPIQPAPPAPPPAPLDQALLAEWAALAEIEPELHPDACPRERYFLHRAPVSDLPVPFAQTMAQWPSRARHIVVTDAEDDAMAGLLLRSLAATSPHVAGIAVATTGEVAADTPAGIASVSLSAAATGLDEEQCCALLVRAVLQRPPETLHLADSAIGRLALSRHAVALHGATRVHLHLAERDAGGATPHGRFAARELPKVIRQISAVIAGGPSCHHWLTEVVGIPAEDVRIADPT